MVTAAYIVGGLGIFFNLLIYQQNTSKRILTVKLISNFVWAVYYLLCGQYTGVCVACIAIVRETTFISVNRKSKLGVTCLCIFAIVAVMSAIFTWQSAFSIFPAVASIIAVFGFYFSIPTLSRILVFPISFCMGTYDIVGSAWMGLANEIITVISAVGGIIFMDILKKGRKVKDKIRVSAVQWDCSQPSNTFWGFYQTRTLSPKKYRTTTPYYADILGENKIDYHWRTQEEFDRESQYGIDAGIDYFSYVFYGEQGSRAHVKTKESDFSDMVYHLNYARKMHESSKLRDKIGMAAIMGQHPFLEPDYLELAELMKQPYYEKYNGRPIVYLFWQINEKDIKGVIKAVEQVGGEKPLFIAMFGGKPPVDYKEDSVNGVKYDLVDGLSAYACSAKNVHAHAELIDKAIQEDIWRAETVQEKIPNGLTVPQFPIGWDPSPRVDIPSPWITYPDVSYAKSPTPQELWDDGKLFAEKIKNTDCLRDTFFGHILMFAWNEFEEGGWICPTYNEDLSINTDKVQAVAKVIKYWKENL
ncbi:MAG: YgjV family protein [Elusimicrobiaceae bacterium]|nr:YgjV family protein [Elusimicrobiaceae bacterium]